MVEYYDANFVSLHVRVSNRPALHMYKDILGFDILGVEKGYYADKEDAYKMKKFFREPEREKEMSKIIQISSDVKWEDIKDTYEEVDANGEEKSEDKEKSEIKEGESKENIVDGEEKAVGSINASTSKNVENQDEAAKKKKKKKNKKK